MKKSTAIAIISVLAVLSLTLGVLYYTSFISGSEKAKTIDGLNDTVAGKTEQIELLTADAAEKAGQIETLTRDVAGRDGQIETLTAEAADRAAQIEALTKDAADKDAQIEALTKDAADKAAQIEALTKDAADKAAQIETLTAEAAEKDAQIEALTKDAADKAAQIGEQEAVIKEQENVIAGKDQAIAELQGKVDSLTAEAEGRAEAETGAQAQTGADAAPGTENRVGKKQSLPEPAGDRLVYTFGGLTVTLPASIRYDKGDVADGWRYFTNSDNPDEESCSFMGMEIDIGLDVSDLDDAMKKLLLESIRIEFEKLETVRNCRFENTEILGNAALNFGFIFTVDGEEAPAYGTIILKGTKAYVLFYAGRYLSEDEVKADMLECIASIREEAGEPAPAETPPAPEPQPAPETQAPADSGNASAIPRFGMTKDELKAALGTWDEEDDFNGEYSIVRYQNIPFHGYVSTYAIVFRNGLLDTWMYGVLEDGMFAGLENELTGLYGAAGENPAGVIRVFRALNTSLTESELELMVGSGALDYRFWHAGDDRDCLLMKLGTDSYTYSVLAFMKPEK